MAVKIQSFLSRSSLLLIFLLIPSSAQAVGDYSTSVKAVYTYSDSGQLQVTQEFSLTNKTTQAYASKFQLDVQSTTIEAVSAKDITDIPVQVSQPQSGITRIEIPKFNTAALGLGKSLKFQINYSGSPAVHTGQVWQVTIPKLINPDFYNKYTLHLVVPRTWGDPALSTPEPQYHYPQNTTTTQKLIFSKNQLMTQPKVLFGNIQSYSFKLNYFLDTAIRPQYITLPPDTAYQQLSFDTLSPAPVNVVVDADGNWIAEYNLAKPQMVVATGKVNVFNEPINFESPAIEPLPQHLQATTFWPATHPTLVELAAKLNTPQQIFSLVKSTLTYDYNRAKSGSAQRQGALQALTHPTNSLCTDYSDLFITLARSRGISSRQLIGFVFTNNTQNYPPGSIVDTLHVWPQYWDQSVRKWISVDPTWADTSTTPDYFHQFDFNHITFAIQGLQDSQPKPAGMYRSADSLKDIAISPTSFSPPPPATPDFKLRYPPQLLPFFLNDVELVAQNSHGIGLYSYPITYYTDYRLDLPPYSSTTLHYRLPISHFLGFKPLQFTLKLADRTIQYNIPVTSYLVWNICVISFLILTIIILAIVAAKSWSVYLQGSRRPHTLRRKG